MIRMNMNMCILTKRDKCMLKPEMFIKTTEFPAMFDLDFFCQK